MIDVAAALRVLPSVFTHQEAKPLGLTPRVIARAVRRKLVRPLGQGLFTDDAVWRSADRRCRQLLLSAAASRAHPELPVSHHSAAMLWSLPTPLHLPSWVCLTTGAIGSTAEPGSAVRLEPGALPARHVIERDGIRVTNPARTVVDCLRALPFADAVAIADAGVARNLVTVEELAAVRAEQRGWPFICQVDDALPILDPRRENWIESYSFARLWQLGIPIPESQVEVYDEYDNFVARLDGLWRELGVVGEVDGAGKYLGEFDADGPGGMAAARRVIAEKVREDRLRDLGLEVVRWDNLDITRHAEQVAARVLRAHRRGDASRFTGRFVTRPLHDLPRTGAPDPRRAA